MIRSKIINIFSMITSIVIFLIFFVGLYLQLFGGINIGQLPSYITSGDLVKNIKSLIFNFAFINAVICFIAAFLMFFVYPRSIRKGRNCAPYLFKTIRYIAASMSVVILFFSLVILTPAFSFKEIFITGNALYKDTLFVNYSAIIFRIIIPVLSLVQYLVLEIEQTRNFRISFVPYAFMLAYGIAMITVVSIFARTDLEAAAKFSPYYFFLYSKDLIKAAGYQQYLSVSRCISMLCIVGLTSFILCVLIWLANQVNGQLMIGYEYVEVDESNKIIKPYHTIPLSEVYRKAEVHVKDENTGEVKKKIQTKIYRSKVIKASKVYHVSIYSRKLMNWKVKLAGASESTAKIFATCKEATAYAKMIAKKNGALVRVHSTNNKED